jgi:hypothetical protein
MAPSHIFSYKTWTTIEIPPRSVTADTDTEAKRRWFREELGLYFDPFALLDAGTDPYLPQYLVGQRAMEQLWGDWPSFLFAPPGGGKTAFRVWLTRVCRTGRDGRRILPVVLAPPRPEEPQTPLPWERYIEALSHAIAASLLLDLAYQPSSFSVLCSFPHSQSRPSRFFDLSEEERGLVRSVLERDLPMPLDYLLDQIADEGSLAPWSRTFDPPSLGLPNEPAAESLRAFCEAMRRAAPTPSSQLPERGEKTIQTLRTILGYSAVYLLVDEADAYIQDPKAIVRLLKPLWANTTAWSRQAVFVKYFLPEEARSKIPAKMLTGPTKCVIIQWEPETLVQVVQERLRIASQGAFYSLTAISTPDVNEDIEFQLARALQPPIPREMLRLLQRVFFVHLQRVGPCGRLQQTDYDKALDWYSGR